MANIRTPDGFRKFYLENYKDVYVIAGINGCYDELIKLLALISNDFDIKQDALVVIGPSIGLGPQSKDVLSHLVNLKDEKVNLFHVISWLEEYLLSVCEDQTAGDVLEILERPTLVAPFDDSEAETDSFLQYWGKGGGRSAFFSYSNRDSVLIPEAHLDFLSTSYHLVETPTHIFAPSPLMSGYSIDQYERDYNRSPLFPKIFHGGVIKQESLFKSAKAGVYGKIWHELPLFTSKALFPDAGCAWGKNLACIRLSDHKTWLVPSTKTYGNNVIAPFISEPMTVH